VEITPHVDAIRSALAAVGGDDGPTAAVAERLAHAVAPAVHLQLLDLLGEVAAEVSSQLPGGRVDLQLSGRDALLVYHDDPEAAPGPGVPVDDDQGTARLTLRMSDALKNAVERAAAEEGLSTNAWLVAAAKRALEPGGPRRRPGRGNRLSGYAQA
jgi:hypothetical protein